jgi:hypothetical protein
MSIKDKKQKVFGEIAAAKTLTTGLPKLKNTNSFPSVNNGNDIILFLSDLVKSLVGQKEFVNVIVETLTKYLDKIERGLKQTIKKVLRNMVSCGVNPSIPSYLKSAISGGSGIIISVDKIDFFDLLKIDPNSSIGGLLYNDTTPPSLSLFDSSDFNTFLYAVIQDPNVTHTWQYILDVKFVENGTGNIPNNSLVVNVNQLYDNKSINDLNDNYVDSLTVIDGKDVLNKIIDLLFGSISVQTNKTSQQLEKEAEINDIIDRLANADVNDEINDDYFTFTNSEIARQQETANNRRNGIIKIKTNVEFNASIPIEQLTTFTDEYNQSATLVEKRASLTKSINNMAENLADQTPNNDDKQTVKISFVGDMIKALIKSVANILISPKIIIIFLINFKIVFGLDAEYTNAKDFIKKNRVLFTSVFKDITQIIVKILMNYALREVTRLAGDAALVKLYEKTQNRKQQLLSLVGVSQEALRKIKGLL